MPVATRQTRTGALALHYSRHPGAGEPVVFINSLGTDLRLWDQILPLLPGGIDVIRYDKRGHGLSGLPPAPYAMSDHVEDLAALLDALGIERVNLVGLSIGGLISQGFALAHPERVRTVALCDTGDKVGTEAMWNERIEAVRANGIPAISDGVLQRWFSERFRAQDPEFPKWRAMLERTPVEGYAGCGESIRDADFRAEVGSIKKPCLCVCGSEDGATPPDLVKSLAAKIEGARYIEIEGVGHLPCVEAPETFAQALRDFWRENGVA